MMKHFFSFLLLFCMAFVAKSQDLSAYKKLWLIEGTDTLPYRLALPPGYDAGKKYPLIIFLHGSGERGNDNEKQLVHGGKLFISPEVQQGYPAIVVFPQCPAGKSWANAKSERDSTGKRIITFPEDAPATRPMEMLQTLIKNLRKEYKISKNQIYAGGLSMGGMGTFDLVRRNPKLFAAAFPICGGYNPAMADKLDKTSWWIFHGAKDDVVPPRLSEQMAEALKKEGASVQFTLYPEAKHDSWTNVFAEKDLMKWLFAQKR